MLLLLMGILMHLNYQGMTTQGVYNSKNRVWIFDDIVVFKATINFNFGCCWTVAVHMISFMCTELSVQVSETIHVYRIVSTGVWHHSCVQNCQYRCAGVWVQENKYTHTMHVCRIVRTGVWHHSCVQNCQYRYLTPFLCTQLSVQVCKCLSAEE